MRVKQAWCGAMMLAMAATPSAAQDPLSAIDWLDRQSLADDDLALAPNAARPSNAARPPGNGPSTKPAIAEPPVTRDARRPEITVRPLDEATSDAVGLLPSHVTGFPQSLWQGSDAARLSDLMIAQNVDGQPAMQSLLFALLLAEALPPAQSEGRFLMARVDRLIALGAVAQAAELLSQAHADEDRDLYARVLDLALLSGPGVSACEKLIEDPGMAPDLDTRVYCLAQGGQWDLALTTLETGRALGDITAARYSLLLAFLDPELASGLPALPPSQRLTPLEYRLHEAIGEPVPTQRLPRAFATDDLTGDSGWKAQIEAGERLVRAGALAEQRLFAFYTLGRASASGGVWDRVQAVQSFETALQAGDVRATATTLLAVWPMMVDNGLATAFAKTYARQLADLPLTGSAMAVYQQVALLSPDYELLSRLMSPLGLHQKFAVALAQGRPQEASAPTSRARAIAEGFTTPPPASLVALLDQDKLGEVILRAMSLTYQGYLGDETSLTEALATLRHVGLEDTARRMALQALLLSAEG